MTTYYASRVRLLFALTALLTGLACNAVFGLDELRTGEPGSDGGNDAADASAMVDGGGRQTDATSSEGGDVSATNPDGTVGQDMDAATPDSMDDVAANDVVTRDVGAPDVQEGGVTCPVCGPHQTCQIESGTASCKCNATICTKLGNVCPDQQSVATCSTDGDACLFVSQTTPCTNAKTCSGMAPGAMCSLTCTDSCTQGQKFCVAGGLATCTLAANGCWSPGAPSACGAHQACTGAAGSAACTCKSDPVCSAAGSVCASASQLATCTTDGQGCVYQSATTPCTNGACSAGACCTNACSNGATQCLTGSSTQIQSCVTGTNTCATWSTADCPSRFVCERIGAASCEDPSWAEWPVPNSQIDVAAGAPNAAKYRDNADGTVTDLVTGLIWQQGIGTFPDSRPSATIDCGILNLAGHKGWRLPTKIELMSIIEFGRASGPLIDPVAFPGTPTSLPPTYSVGDWFWTATAVVGSGYTFCTIENRCAMAIDFQSGAVQVADSYTQYYVRCVF